jgi:hypothetical protein
MKVSKHLTLREQWPPAPQSAARGFDTLVGHHDILDAVYFYPGGGRWHPNVTLKTKYVGRTYARDIFLQDGRFAERLALLFKRHIGQTVEELGDLEIGC